MCESKIPDVERNMADIEGETEEPVEFHVKLTGHAAKAYKRMLELQTEARLLKGKLDELIVLKGMDEMSHLLGDTMAGFFANLESLTNAGFITPDVDLHAAFNKVKAAIKKREAEKRGVSEDDGDPDDDCCDCEDD